LAILPSLNVFNLYETAVLLFKAAGKALI